MLTLSQDLRHGFRILCKNPAFTAIAVVSLAIGIGANTTIFSLVNALLLDRVPVRSPQRLVFLYTQDPKIPGYLPCSYPNYLDYRDRNTVFSGLVLSSGIRLNLGLANEPEQVIGQIVSGNYFSVLGVKPVVGRAFLEEEDRTPGASPVVVISHGLWASKFGADPGILGKQIRLNGRKFTIIGVAPQGFHGTNTLAGADVWVPMMMYREVYPMVRQAMERRALLFNVIGRLKPGIGRSQAEAAMRTLAAQLAQQYPEENGGRTLTLLRMTEATINPNHRGTFVLAGTLLMIVVGMVLLIACANVANLLLARASSRSKEIAIRLAMGAGRGRILRQLLTESLILSFLGGALGLLLARWGRDVLWSTRPPFLQLTRLNLELNPRVLGFTLALSAVTGVLFGLAPALHILRADLATELKERTAQFVGPRGRFHLRNLLVIFQLSLSLVALVASGLFLRSLQNARQTQLGFETAHQLVMTYNLATSGYSESRGRAFDRQVLERVRRLPFVQSAALAANEPFSGGMARTVLTDAQQRVHDRGLLALYDNVDEEYFQTAGIPILRGRAFTPLDNETSPRVAIINETMARRYWSAPANALGKTFRLFGDNFDLQVVGIARDSTYIDIGEKPWAMIYVPLRQSYTPAVTLYVRTVGEPTAALATVRKTIQTIDPNLLLRDVETMPQVIAESLWAPRMAATVLSLFGLLALLLASVGVYGVISYSISQRAREIGIRMALGAGPADVLRQVLREGMFVAGIGIAVGLVCAFAVTRLLANLLFGVGTADPLTFTAVPLILLLVALAACYIPALRSTKVDPSTALRHE